MVKWADKNTQDKAGIIVKRIKTGFTLMEMLIVIAIIAVLIAIAIPVFSSQLEKAREATDLTNVRSAYAQVSTEALLGNSEITVTVDLTQKQADWQSLDPVDIGGIVHYKKQGALLRRTEPALCHITKITESFSLGAERPARLHLHTRLIQA